MTSHLHGALDLHQHAASASASSAGHHDSEITTFLMHASIGKIILTAMSLGIVHVLTGPDHISALAALSSGRSWRFACQLGMQWGIGHSLGIVLIAFVCIWLGHAVDLGGLRVFFNYMAGGFLVGIGIWTWYSTYLEYRQRTSIESKWKKVECQDATYTLLSPDDAHSVQVLGDFVYFSSPSFHGEYSNGGRPQTAASVCVGLLHGVAGPGGVLGVLPVIAMHEITHALTYLLSFCASSVVCMGVFAAIYGEITKRSSMNSDVAAYWIGVLSSCLSIGVGVLWIALQAMGVLDHVFGHHDDAL